MEIEVDQETIEATTECEKDFACLSSKERVYCPVEDLLLGRIPFVRCLHDEPCVYQSKLEGFAICTCPTRKAIYKKYQM